MVKFVASLAFLELLFVVLASAAHPRMATRLSFSQGRARQPGCQLVIAQRPPRVQKGGQTELKQLISMPRKVIAVLFSSNLSAPHDSSVQRMLYAAINAQAFRNRVNAVVVDLKTGDVPSRIKGQVARRGAGDNVTVLIRKDVESTDLWKVIDPRPQGVLPAYYVLDRKGTKVFGPFTNFNDNTAIYRSIESALNSGA